MTDLQLRQMSFILTCLFLAPFNGGSAGRNVVQHGSDEGPRLHEQGGGSDEYIRRGNQLYIKYKTSIKLQAFDPNETVFFFRP